MNPRPSRLLQALREGRYPSVFKLNLSDPRVAEIAGLCGVDALWLCMEHVANDWLTIENQIRAAKMHNVDTLVRVARGSYSDHLRPLEADATGIIVPHVSSVEEARQIVDWARFHPLGRRPLDGGNADGAYCLMPLADYLHHSNTERVVIVQIESPEALEHVEGIAAVAGIDGLMLGPGDFSHRIGKPGQIDAPEVVAARKRVGAACRANGKFAMAAGLFAPAADLIAEGYSVFGIGADVIGIGNYVTERLKVLERQLEGTQPQPRPGTSPYR